MRRIAEEHHVAAAPGLDADRRELAPDAAVGDQPVSLELLLEQLLQKRRGFGLARLVHARGAPRRLAAFDDERRAGPAVLVRVHTPQPVRGVLEVEGEGGKRPGRAEPDEPVRTDVHSH